MRLPAFSAAAAAGGGGDDNGTSSSQHSPPSTSPRLHHCHYATAAVALSPARLLLVLVAAIVASVTTTTAQNIVGRDAPAPYRSCLDAIVANGDATTGTYNIQWEGDSPRRVYCVYDNRIAYTLIRSFEFQHKDVFRSMGFIDSRSIERGSADAPFNGGQYSLSWTLMTRARVNTDLTLFSCNLDLSPTARDRLEYENVNFNLLTFRGNGVCITAKARVRGYVYDGQVPIWQSDGYSHHLDSSGNGGGNGCGDREWFNGAVSSEDDFGFYGDWNTQFGCAMSPTSSTNTWFGQRIRDCVADVGEWSACSQSCHTEDNGGVPINGVESRTVTVTQQPTPGGVACPAERQRCEVPSCAPPPIDCVGEYTSACDVCSVTCGAGVRQCKLTVTVQPQHNGRTCEDVYGSSRTRVLVCSVDRVCPPTPVTSTPTPTPTPISGIPTSPPMPTEPVVDCRGTLGAFSECSQTCGYGTRTRTFVVLTPASGGGRPCERPPPEALTQDCNMAPCSENDCVGTFTAWNTTMCAPPFCASASDDVFVNVSPHNATRRFVVSRAVVNGGVPCRRTPLSLPCASQSGESSIALDLMCRVSHDAAVANRARQPTADDDGAGTTTDSAASNESPPSDEKAAAGPPIAMIAGAAVGGLVCLIVSAIVWKKRKRGHKRPTPDGKESRRASAVGTGVLGMGMGGNGLAGVAKTTPGHSRQPSADENRMRTSRAASTVSNASAAALPPTVPERKKSIGGGLQWGKRASLYQSRESRRASVVGEGGLADVDAAAEGGIEMMEGIAVDSDTSDDSDASPPVLKSSLSSKPTPPPRTPASSAEPSSSDFRSQMTAARDQKTQAAAALDTRRKSIKASLAASLATEEEKQKAFAAKKRRKSSFFARKKVDDDDDDSDDQDDGGAIAIVVGDEAAAAHSSIHHRKKSIVISMRNVDAVATNEHYGNYDDGDDADDI